MEQKYIVDGCSGYPCANKTVVITMHEITAVNDKGEYVNPECILQVRDDDGKYHLVLKHWLTKVKTVCPKCNREV